MARQLYPDIVLERASKTPDRPVLSFLSFGVGEKSQEESLNYRALVERSLAIAQYLNESGFFAQRVLLLFPPSIDYFPALLACLLSGNAAVPAFPPDPTRLERSLPPLLSIARDCKPAVILTLAAIRDAAMPLMNSLELHELTKVRWVALEEIDDLSTRAKLWKRPSITDESIALCQYTSGSVSDARGVLISHKNLLANQFQLAELTGYREGSAGVAWLPHVHDMGSHSFLLSIYVGATGYIMSPLDFLQNPKRWLRTISEKRAYVSGAPNFAYDFCVRRIAQDQCVDLDLRSWEVAYNSAETVQLQTMDRFSKHFAASGFRRSAFLPCYGLAEMTVIATGGPKNTELKHVVLDAQALERNEVIATSSRKGNRVIVACGAIPKGVFIRIVDPASLTPCAVNQIGEVWIDGDSKAVGYFNRPEETKERFCARLAGDSREYLRTGDLGFVQDGQLFITGRRSELLIVAGKNHYAHDLEKTAEAAHVAVRPGGCAAFAIAVADQEEVILVAELDLRKAAETSAQDVIEAIRRQIALHHEIRLHDVKAIRPSSLHKTTSGKVQRNLCRARYLEGQLDMIESGTT